MSDLVMRVRALAQSGDVTAVRADIVILCDEFIAQREEIGRLGPLAYVAGSWECPVCGYAEVKSILYAMTGQVGVNPEPALPCPNDGATMRASTWKGHAKAMDEYVGKVEAERLALAKLAHPLPQFSNPLDVFEAEAIRDRVLGIGQ